VAKKIQYPWLTGLVCVAVVAACGGSNNTTDVPAVDMSTRDVVAETMVGDSATDGGVLPGDVVPQGDSLPRLDAVPRDSSTIGTACASTPALDLLVVVDNSNSMSDNQNNLASNFGSLLNRLINPPRIMDPMTGMLRPAAPPIQSLHVGVISVDLGTPGSTVPSCANGSLGDDGLINPVRAGVALRTHQPWTTAPPGRRPPRCTNDPMQYPTFLTFRGGVTNAMEFSEDFVCNAYLSIGGCGIEQQLESAYRALVTHNPREQAGNTDPNAGFVRSDAVLGILMVTDEEDGSVRDCRYAEPGVACNDATSVFDILSPSWSSNDLNLRMYLYTPGSAEDPTWPIDRYMDPTNPMRGFTSLKPGRPEMVIFGAIAGVPINVPMAGDRVNWDALLGRSPDGSDGPVSMSAEGPVSMRHANRDMACSNRVVPSCRREGSTESASCSTMDQYFAWPSRRVAQVVRRFDETWRNGTISSICKADYTSATDQFVDRVQRRFCPP
jgi:hypothetical protein